jgi:tight adherence protein C
MRVLASEYRDARMFRAEEKAARLPALMTVPMILFILPTLFIVLMGPAALNIVDTFNRSGSGAPRQVTVVSHSGSGDAGAGPEDTQITEQPADEPPASNAGLATAKVTPTRQTVAAGQPLVVDVEAQNLGSGSNWRIVMVPATTPDAVAAPETFFATAKEVAPTQMEVTLQAHGAGQSEVRLYYMPHLSSTYAVAARAWVMVTGSAK